MFFTLYFALYVVKFVLLVRVKMPLQMTRSITMKPSSVDEDIETFVPHFHRIHISGEDNCGVRRIYDDWFKSCLSKIVGTQNSCIKRCMVSGYFRLTSCIKVESHIYLVVIEQRLCMGQ